MIEGKGLETRGFPRQGPIADAVKAEARKLHELAWAETLRRVYGDETKPPSTLTGLQSMVSR